MFYLATAEALHALGYLTRYVAPALVIGEREALKADAVTAIAKAGDWCLMVAILLVLALGLRELLTG